ncbi:MAG: CBS domain-containing protein, partial [Methanomicrobium sp.]|nr:CBS domain-containing protein [Methanomicrobium sp.]
MNRRLKFMQIKDVMTPNPVTVKLDSKISEAAGVLRKFRIGGLPQRHIVIDALAQHNLVGLAVVAAPDLSSRDHCPKSERARANHA